MALFSRVWRPSGGIFVGVGCDSGNGCPTGCYNMTQPNQSLTHPSLTIDVPYAVATCIEAIEYYADQLRKRLGARACFVQSTTNAAFNLTVKRSGKLDTTIVIRPAMQCQYPVSIDYTYGSRSETNRQFQAMVNALDWLVEELA